MWSRLTWKSFFQDPLTWNFFFDSFYFRLDIIYTSKFFLVQKPDLTSFSPNLTSFSPNFAVYSMFWPVLWCALRARKRKKIYVLTIFLVQPNPNFLQLDINLTSFFFSRRPSLDSTWNVFLQNRHFFPLDIQLHFCTTPLTNGLLNFGGALSGQLVEY